MTDGGTLRVVSLARPQNPPTWAFLSSLVPSSPTPRPPAVRWRRWWGSRSGILWRQARRRLVRKIPQFMGTARLSSSARASNSRPRNRYFSKQLSVRLGRRIGVRRVRSVLLTSGTHFGGNEARVNGGAISIVNPELADPLQAQGLCFSTTLPDGQWWRGLHCAWHHQDERRVENSAEDVFEENTGWKFRGAIFTVGTNTAFAKGANCAKSCDERRRRLHYVGALAEDASSLSWSSLAPVHAESTDDNRAAFGNERRRPLI